MGRIAPLLAAVGFSIVASIASAHTTVTTPDGKYFITVGNLNEPVTTFTKTGLDLVIRANASGVRGDGASAAHLTLNATLLAPDGSTLTQALRSQFGVSGGYSFTDPYVLTVPGTYNLRLRGSIGSSSANIDSILVGSGPVPAMEDVFFPDSDLDSPKEIEARVKALEMENAELKANMQTLLNNKSSAKSPGFEGVVVLVVALAALALRRRAA